MTICWHPACVCVCLDLPLSCLLQCFCPDHQQLWSSLSLNHAIKLPLHTKQHKIASLDTDDWWHRLTRTQLCRGMTPQATKHTLFVLCLKATYWHLTWKYKINVIINKFNQLKHFSNFRKWSLSHFNWGNIYSDGEMLKKLRAPVSNWNCQPPWIALFKLCSITTMYTFHCSALLHWHWATTTQCSHQAPPLCYFRWQAGIKRTTSWLPKRS